MVSCVSKTPSGQIDKMLKRVDAVEREIDVLYTQDFDYLVREYQALDTTVVKTENIYADMALLQAYLQQFETYRVVIYENAELSRKQLSDLKDDVKNHLYDEQTTTKYIKDEDYELRVMEAQIKYFHEKFDAQKEVVKQMKKE